MRIAIYVLIVANLGFWAWASWIRPEPQPLSAYDGPGLTLLRELPPDSPLRVLPADSPLRTPPGGPAGGPSAADNSAQPAAGVTGSTSAAPEIRNCIAVGPFIDAAAADAAAERLADQASELDRFDLSAEIWDGYWVYIAQIANRDEAQSILTELRDNGIDDAYVIPNSERGILISLGVFSDVAGAGLQAERVGEIGFEATISDRMREADTVWLRLSLSGETDVLALLEEPGAIRRLEQRDCAAGED